MEAVGTRVIRGPDWLYGDQDGGDGHVGTVTRVGGDSDETCQMVWVQWDCGDRANYRAGFRGKHDLLVLDNRNAGKLTDRAQYMWRESFLRQDLPS